MIRDDEIHYACVDDYDDDCVIMIVVNYDYDEDGDNDEDVIYDDADDYTDTLMKMMNWAKRCSLSR